jgi:hypothetical protein
MTSVQAHQTQVALARASEAVLSACREDETDLPDSTRAPDVHPTGRFTCQRIRSPLTTCAPSDQ